MRRSCKFPRFPYENFRQCKNRVRGCDYVRKSCKFQKVPPRTKSFGTVRQNNFEKNSHTQSLVYRCFRQNRFIFNLMKAPHEIFGIVKQNFKNRYSLYLSDGITWDRHTSSKRSFHETLKYCQKKFRHCQTNDFWQNRTGGCDYVRRWCKFPRFPYENFRQCKNRIGGCDYVRKSCKFQKVPPRTKIFGTVRQNNFEKNRDTQSLVYRCFRQNPFIFNNEGSPHETFGIVKQNF